ncbi:MAG: sigma-70 family RNA polymerase sigma factor [Patescibacteria group bacterium]|nr:sigma-70 family RNA polymerase sigma factor [Patescibacteria group bacterium]
MPEKDREIELIRACQTGQNEAFGQIYDLYFEKIYRFIYYKVSHRESAEDLTSLTFTKALQNLKKFNTDQGLFSAWLYKIARNSIIDHYRSNAPVYDLEASYGLHLEENIEEHMDQQQELASIKEKLELLSPEQKEIVVMRVWNELSYKEISQTIGKSENNCKVIFSRALKQLKSSLVVLIIILSLLTP